MRRLSLMPRQRTNAWLLIALCLAGCNAVPAPVMKALQNGDQYELLSLDPDRSSPPAPGNFHRWKVLGRTTVADAATRKRLNDALRAGARENNNAVALCFNPRHGIRVRQGDSVLDLVICFECLQVEVFEGEQRGASFLTSDSPQSVFDEVLREAGVALADKAQ